MLLYDHIGCHVGIVGRYPFRPRPSLNNGISVISNDLWRHPGEVRALAANQFVA
jgi:hypothetical protein